MGIQAIFTTNAPKSEDRGSREKSRVSPPCFLNDSEIDRNLKTHAVLGTENLEFRVGFNFFRSIFDQNSLDARCGPKPSLNLRFKRVDLRVGPAEASVCSPSVAVFGHAKPACLVLA
jgi:hypothetical protein